MIAAIARELVGLEGEPHPLPGELDRNFALDGHVFKIHAPGTDPAWLDLQDAAMEHVAGRTGELATPRLVPARSRASAAPWRRSTSRWQASSTRRSTGRCAGT